MRGEERLTPAHGRTLVAEMLAEGLDPLTVTRKLVPLRAALSDAVDDGLIPSNPLARTRVPHPRKPEDAEREARVLTGEEVRAIIAAAAPKYRTLIRTAAVTGMRRSEVLGLRWRDIDHEAGLIHVRRRSRRGTIAAPKSKNGTRSIPVPADLLADLELERLTALHPQDDDPVFHTATGSPLYEENVSRRGMKPAAEAAGVPWARFHDLRRAAITRWIVDHRMDPKTVQRLAGHHDAAFTLNVHARLGDRLPDGELLGVL